MTAKKKLFVPWPNRFGVINVAQRDGLHESLAISAETHVFTWWQKEQILTSTSRDSRLKSPRLAIVAGGLHCSCASSHYLQLKTASRAVLDVGHHPNLGAVGPRV